MLSYDHSNDEISPFANACSLLSVHKMNMNAHCCLFPLGGAIGCSSILLIRPTDGAQPPKGVVVALLVNLQQVHLEKTAMAVAACFQKVQSF